MIELASASTRLAIEKVYHSVYRLEDDGSLLKEGGGGLPLRPLRAGSYKTEAEDRHQRLCPPSSSKGLSGFLSFVTDTVSLPATPNISGSSIRGMMPEIYCTDCIM